MTTIEKRCSGKRQRWEIMSKPLVSALAYTVGLRCAASFLRRGPRLGADVRLGSQAAYARALEMIPSAGRESRVRLRTIPYAAPRSAEYAMCVAQPAAVARAERRRWPRRDAHRLPTVGDRVRSVASPICSATSMAAPASAPDRAPRSAACGADRRFCLAMPAEHGKAVPGLRTSRSSVSPARGTTASLAHTRAQSRCCRRSS